jgi:hypothetical protein
MVKHYKKKSMTSAIKNLEGVVYTPSEFETLTF